MPRALRKAVLTAAILSKPRPGPALHHCRQRVVLERERESNRMRRGVSTMKSRTLKAGTLAVVLLGLSAPVLSGTAGAQGIDPAELVRDIHAIFGEHHARAVHAKGVILNATFEPTEQA